MIKPLLLSSLAWLPTLIDAAPVEVRSVHTKRGIGFNDPALTNYFIGSCTWMYNWVGAGPGAASGLEYVPMLHSAESVFTDAWNGQVNGNTKHILSFNEPDQCGGGGTCVTDPGVAANNHKTWVQPLANKYPNLLVGAPAVTNGVQSPTGTVMGAPYLKQFLASCTGCKIDFVVAHWYDDASNTAYFKQHMKDIYAAGGNRPVWITEFGVTGGDADAFLRDVLPWMDGQDWIHRYAYHYASPGLLINTGNNGLSPLGITYTTI